MVLGRFNRLKRFSMMFYRDIKIIYIVSFHCFRYLRTKNYWKNMWRKKLKGNRPSSLLKSSKSKLGNFSLGKVVHCFMYHTTLLQHTLTFILKLCFIVPTLFNSIIHRCVILSNTTNFIFLIWAIFFLCFRDSFKSRC